MIEPLQPEHAGYWILALKPEGEEPGSSKGGRPPAVGRAKPAFDRCWTGSEWAAQLVFAMRFDSRLAAQEYLVENRGVMEGAVEGGKE